MSDQSDMGEICQGLREMFYGVNMIQIGEGFTHAGVHLLAQASSSPTGKALLSCKEGVLVVYFVVCLLSHLDYSHGCSSDIVVSLH